MSGRTFIPNALNNFNLFTDATALQFEMLFIKGFVNRFKNRDEIMQRLNGEKVLIKGNHDKDQLGWYMKYFKDIRGTHHIDGNYLLSHFPIHSDSKGRFVRGLHGHIHAQTVMKSSLVHCGFVREPDPWYRNCCVEVNNYSPIPFEVIKEETEKLIENGVIVIPKKGSKID